MPLEIILNVAAQKEMKILFKVEIIWHERSMRTHYNSNNELVSFRMKSNERRKNLAILSLDYFGRRFSKMFFENGTKIGHAGKTTKFTDFSNRIFSRL